MYSGNATVVNALMRFPALIPVAAIAAVVIGTTPEPTPAPPPAPVVSTVKTEPAPVVTPAPTVKPTPTPVEALCPPKEKLTKAELAKLTARERGALKVRGCIKG